jgi:hypothetical protein
MLGFPGNDSLVYRCVGAGAFGYPVRLVLALRQQSWAALRMPVIATLVLNLASIFACAMEIVSDKTQPIVYVVGILSVVIAAITASQLKRYAGEQRPTPDISSLLRGGLILGGILSASGSLVFLVRFKSGPARKPGALYSSTLWNRRRASR